MNLYTGHLELTHKVMLTHDTVVLKLKTLSGQHLIQKNPLEGPLPFQTGQFINLLVAEKTWRSYSIASLPTEDVIELVIRYVENGIGSEAIKTWPVGQTIEFKGSFGHFFLSNNSKAKLHFCATGTGIAPFKAMIREESAQATPRNMTLYYGGKNNQDLAYLDELTQWAADLNVCLGFSRQTETIEIPGCEVKNARITNFLESAHFDQHDEFYICGNGNMVKSVEAILAEKNVPKENIFMERFN